ncbi:DNA cross-link repair 1A protein [Geosmithia morbida]|uniref:DNA cross-link repair 1A protein n=1 Tax=Geosmithia morbida TaxID=1094350 RepID=A0A9P5D5V1_9HYPO|nr:DNA cross-link repair 1A protein [Geosmithia morbida]KAF4124160.1 DNA cross-link repair 1A protein [Geosmithia morbida]
MAPSTKSRQSKTPKRQTTLSASSFSRGTPKPVKSTRPNASILSFFKKTDKPDDSLFIGAAPESLTHDDEGLFGSDDEDRFNETLSSVKRRRMSHIGPETSEDASAIDTTRTLVERSSTVEDGKTAKGAGKRKVQGPFVMDSDSEDEDDGDSNPSVVNPAAKKAENQRSGVPANSKAKTTPDLPPVLADECVAQGEPLTIPPDNFEVDFELAKIEDDDIYAFEGEEMRQMRYMRELARLESRDVEAEDGSSGEDFADDPLSDDGIVNHCCPICQGSIFALSPDEATRHVNLCIDGNAPPLVSPEQDRKPEVKEISLRDLPKPGQANPFDAAAPSEPIGKSAFSKIMSSKAEALAWSTAAAAEKSSRGRFSYQRTCPFYKIIPGFSISVDAFRYGAIEGCQAYFLSHFHSDHYIGLTAKWSHGPIYCSRVTGSLVRQQLKTAEKWVVELDFEKPYDIPGTDGATVTMIPANHCPGSSLFLFLKVFKNSTSSYTKRILHCGDFRACPSHVEHPSLKPDIMDPVSGKMTQQKIDICYLDTTYLSPRYSFPPQGDVIQACAQLCASMSADPNGHDVTPGKSNGTHAVSKYFQKGEANSVASAPVGKPSKNRLLVVCGTYSIGKERMCVAIAQALDTKIFASPSKIKICKQLGIPELTERLTSNPVEAQVHLQMIMEIRADTLQEYLNSYKAHFSHIVGFRPSGWSFRAPNAKFVPANMPPSTISTQKLLHDKAWRTRFSSEDLVAQRGSTKEARCFGVPYSEHSSFRELAMFIMALRIEKVVPTVNVGSEQSRSRMKAWNDRWIAERRKHGLVRPLVEGRDAKPPDEDLWGGGMPGSGGCAWW